MEAPKQLSLKYFPISRPTTISKENKDRIVEKYGRDVEWRYP